MMGIRNGLAATGLTLGLLGAGVGIDYGADKLTHYSTAAHWAEGLGGLALLGGAWALMGHGDPAGTRSGVVAGAGLIGVGCLIYA
jgi:hypothetical protein